MTKIPSGMLAGVLLLGCTGGFGGDLPAAVRQEGLMCMDDLGAVCPLYGLDEGEGNDLVLGGCWVTGGGHVGDYEDHPGAGRAEQDSFGFNAMGMKDGTVRGELENTTHLGDVFHGEASWIYCWRDEGIGPEVPAAYPNNAEWGGTGVWNHDDGYVWEVHFADRAEGGHHLDEYEIWIWDAGGDLAYSESEIIDGGNFQIHPPNSGHPYVAGVQP